MKKVIFSAIILGLLVAGATLFGLVIYVNSMFAAIDPSDHTDIHYTVQRGETLSSVGADLESQGIIKKADGLKLYARMYAVGGNIQAGEHILRRSDEVATMIAAMELPPEPVTITILPGWRREEIAEYLDSLSLPEFDSEEFLKLTKNLEGKLMPETYKVAPMSTTQLLVGLLHDEYESEVTNNPDFQAKLAASGRSEDEIITVASLLQREGLDAQQMRMIAGIIYARLEENYPLQLCATAQYATGKNAKSGKWWDPPTLEDTKVESPYNTYVVKGLPPGPISSVSMVAIEAALTPEESDYYYYLHDSQGVIHYAKTDDEHNRNKELYL